MSALARLAARLTLPYRRGAEFLPIAVAAPAGGTSAIPAYHFGAYKARWGELPASPAYVLAPRTDIGIDAVEVVVSLAGGSLGSVSLTIPAGTAAETPFPITLPPGSTAGLRLTAIKAVPALPAIGGAAWDVVALLGTTAKVAWLIGAEKDAILRQLALVRAQRFVETAVAAGLDRIGEDLSVPRFPPRPYGFDGDLVGLWHLDDGPGATAQDATTIGAVAGHPGTVVGAVERVPGKYGSAFSFPGSGGAAGAAVVVASSPDFDIPATADATMEAFVNAAVPADTKPRAILARRASESAAPATVPGWSLCVVNARGFAGNVMFALCDGTNELRCFADLSVTDGGFHHVAGIVDRGAGRARLLIDGVVMGSAKLDGIGAITSPADLRFGSTATGNGFTGIIDEVRLSRVARPNFHPVLGESDEAYRARLRIFRGWTLPTPERLIALINAAAPLGNDPAPYVLTETNRTTLVATRTTRIVPALLSAGSGIAADGAPARDETVAGRPGEDEGFDPTLDLLVYAHDRVSTAGDPGGGRMQAATARRLDRLAERIAAAIPALPATSKLLVRRSFDPSGPSPLHTVGRALRVAHEAMPLDKLAALAHRAGFAYVANLGTEVALAAAPGERLAIRGGPASGARADLGTALKLAIDPPPPAGVKIRWTMISPGSALGILSAHPDDPASLTSPVATRPRVLLTLNAAGLLAVRVEVTQRNVVRSGTLTLRIDPVMLADGHAIDATGTLDPDVASILGDPEPDFRATDLLTHAPDSRVSFAAGANTARMQVAVRDALDGLLDLLAARGITDPLAVTKGYDPAASGIEKVGRRLVLTHPTLDPGTLAALASRFFDVVSRAGAAVSASIGLAPRLAIGIAGNGKPIPDEIEAGTALTLSPVPPKPAGSGTYSWSLGAVGQGTGVFAAPTSATTGFMPTDTGAVALALTYVAGDDARLPPYTFELTLKPSLDNPATIVPKPQYDIIMNMLDAFHPIGVEVRTDRLRKHVPEVEQDPQKAFPAYSFPEFRL